MRRLGCLGCSVTLGLVTAAPTLAAATGGFSNFDLLFPAAIGILAAVLIRGATRLGGDGSGDDDSRLVA